MAFRRRRRPPRVQRKPPITPPTDGTAAAAAALTLSLMLMLPPPLLLLILRPASVAADVVGGPQPPHSPPPGSTVPEVRRYLRPSVDPPSPSDDDGYHPAVPPGREGRAELLLLDHHRRHPPPSPAWGARFDDDRISSGMGVGGDRDRDNELHLALLPSRRSSISELGDLPSPSQRAAVPRRNVAAGNPLDAIVAAPSPPTTTASARSDRSTNPTHAYRKTGTTIVGCLADSGRTVIIGADTRATDGTTVADGRCEKVHRLADNVWCCGAGTSGDIDALVRRVKFTFLLRGTVACSIGNGAAAGDLDAAEAGRGDDDDDEQPTPTVEEEQMRQWLPPAPPSAVVRSLRDALYESNGGIGANLILGGYDIASDRAVLTAIHPHGSVDSVPYAALGSGGLAAMSILESRYRPDVTVQDAVRIVREAVGAGITNDLGSGSQIDLCVIGPDGVKYERGAVPEEVLPVTEGDTAAEELLRRRHLSAGGGDDDDGGGGGGEEEGAVILNGVNGFGSLPYAIKSRRVIVRNEEVVERDWRESVERVLNLI